MASVFLASVEENPKLKVAIKFAKTDSSGPIHEDILLQREAAILSRWDWRHPGIVRLFPIPYTTSDNYTLRAVEVLNEPWYFVMEYLRGLSLAENLKKINKYPLDWKLELIYHILLSVSFLHQKGYAHRDIKPDNIVFRELISINSIPQPVLVDFALVTNGEQNYQILEECMTVEYSSPEVILASMGTKMDMIEDPRPSDIWSMGIVWYEILTGELPIKGNRKRIRTTIIKEQLEPEFSNEDPRYHLLANYLRSMLNRNPKKRPTIKEVLYALEESFLPPRIII